jgi:hypothetical protein
MSDINVPKIPKGLDLTPEQIEAISGGDGCVSDFVTVVPQLKQAYDDLVDFTSYVMERVSNSL